MPSQLDEILMVVSVFCFYIDSWFVILA